MKLRRGVAPLNWLFRTLRGLCRHQNASRQQVEAGPAVALPLQQFEAGDLAFCLAITPGQGQSRAHRSAVPLQAGGECLDGADAARTGFGQPSIEAG